MKDISRSYDTCDYANYSSDDHNSETREKYYPFFGWRTIGAEIDKS